MKKKIFTDQIGPEVGDNTKSDYVIYKNSDKIPISDLIFHKKNEGGKDFGCYPCNKLVHYNNFGSDSDYYKIGFGSDMFWCGDDYMSIPNFIAGDEGFLNSDTNIKQKLGSTNKDYQPSIYFSEGHEDITFNHQLLYVSSFTSYKKNEDTQIKVGKDADLLFEEEVHRDGRDMHELEINVIDAPVIDENNQIPFWDETTLYNAHGLVKPSRKHGKNFLGIRNDNDIFEYYCTFFVYLVWTHIIPYGFNDSNRHGPYGSGLVSLHLYNVNEVAWYPILTAIQKFLIGYHNAPNDPDELYLGSNVVYKNFNEESKLKPSIFDHYFHDQGSTEPVIGNLSWAEIVSNLDSFSFDTAAVAYEIYQKVQHNLKIDPDKPFGSIPPHPNEKSFSFRYGNTPESLFKYALGVAYFFIFYSDSMGENNLLSFKESGQLLFKDLYPKDPDNLKPSLIKLSNLLGTIPLDNDFVLANGKDFTDELINLYGLKYLGGNNTEILQNCFPKGLYGTNSLLTYSPIINFRWPKDATSANGTELFDGTIGPPLRSFTPNKKIRYTYSYDQDIIDYVTAPPDTVNFTVEI